MSAFLRRRSSIPVWVDVAWRIGLVLGLIIFVLLVHWLEREGLKDNLDNHISFSDIVYFTAVTVTTTGYGDIVPVTTGTRLFDALVVTPIRLFVWLIFLGTAYQFVIKDIWGRWHMARIQRELTGHIVVTGFGTSGAEAVRELCARGRAPDGIVVIDTNEAALAEAEAIGCNILNGDATRDEVLKSVHIDRACSMIVSAGRDDTSILITLTARHLSPEVPISIVVRNEDNELPARQAGATTVINPVSFAGLLLAGSCHGTHIADYMADLASSDGRVKLSERKVSMQEVGKPLSAITSGLGVRIYRDAQPIGFWEPGAQALQAGDMIVEIVPGEDD